MHGHSSEQFPGLISKTAKMYVAHAISTSFIAISIFLLALIQFNDSNGLIYYGKVAQAWSPQNSTFLSRVINAVAKITVPKSWFAHFYVLFSILIWGQLVVIPDLIFANGKYSLVWMLLACQATRRLYESYFVTRWGPTSRMHVCHYLLGLIFYVGVPATCFFGLRNQDLAANASGKPWGVLEAFLVGFFVVVQVDQARNHRHLASLVKYSAPSHGLFAVASSAHYFDEIMVYFTVMVSAFSRGHVIAEDWTLFSIWVFVVTNLSISAVETHKYYSTKFDDFSVKYAIIPGLI